MHNKTNIQLRKRWPIITGALFVASLAALSIWTNTNLKTGSYSYPTEKVYIFSYELTQTPARPLSGQTSNYRFRITKDGKPLANHKVKIGISHAYGIGVTDRDDDQIRQESVTDANGYVEISHTPRFWSLLPDRGFGAYASPILTLPEEQQREEDIKKGTIKAEGNWSHTFSIPAIYPRWLGWFIW